MQNQDHKRLNYYNYVISSLHSHLKRVGRFPHPAQFPILKAFFQDHKKIIQGQCGRSTGKTECILYTCWRYALTNPGVEIYIICPQIKQAKKIYWLNRRLQTYGPQEFVLEHRESELRTVFTNGSYIILDGCENYDSLRGIKPALVVYDEFQHHTREFDEDVMQPNLASGRVSLIVMGTPPKRICYYTEFREYHLGKIQAGDNHYRYYVELPTSANPTQDRVWLAQKKQELIDKKRENTWLREYEGKLVFDTESAVFPFFDIKTQGVPNNELKERLAKDRRKLNYYALFDPGSTTVFAVLFVAINKYTSQIFILDELYLKEKTEMVSEAVFKRAQSVMAYWNDHEEDWGLFYDEAAAWFANEVQSSFGVNLIPTQKSKQVRFEDDGRPGESLLNTVMLEPGIFHVNENCESFVWEMENYVKDEQGRYPKNHDHLVDLLFYLVQVSHYELRVRETDREPNEFDDRRHPKTIGQAILELRTKNDIAANIDVDYYDQNEVDDIWMQ